MSQKQDKPRFIVMPFQPSVKQDYEGTGLALHFFLGNVMAVQTLLKEFWFGWRVNKIFKDQNALTQFFYGKKNLDDIAQLAKEQEIKYWLNGKYSLDNEKINLELTLSVSNGHVYEGAVDEGSVENRKIKEYVREFQIDISDNLLCFRDEFINWLEEFSLPFKPDQLKKIMWPEHITLKGLDFLGRSMEATYMNYMDTSEDKKSIDLEFFEKAVLASPESYLAWDMKGWGLYKNKAYKEAKAAFTKAVALNKDGLGALSGLMWCYIFINNQQLADKYAIAKADVRNENREKASAFVINKIKKAAE